MGVFLTNALSGWRGTSGEEHDFGFETADVEVKTTTNETRKHWISSLEQLQATMQRELWLISIQLTEAGETGFTLGSLISKVRTKLTSDADQMFFATLLLQAGWQEAHSDLYIRRFRVRSTPGCYLVNSEFPRLTREQLDKSKIEHGRIAELRYLLDLTGVMSNKQYPPLLHMLLENDPFE